MCRVPDALLVLAATLVSGTRVYILEVPSQHIALEGPLTVTVIPKHNASQPPDDGGYLDEERSKNYSTDRSEIRGASHVETSNHPAEITTTVPSGHRRHLDVILSLYYNEDSLMNYTLTEHVQQETFVFPCGTVAHAGQYFVSLVQGNRILSRKLMRVQWPEVRAVLPEHSYTHLSNVGSTFKFVGRPCISKAKLGFKTWAVLYRRISSALSKRSHPNRRLRRHDRKETRRRRTNRSSRRPMAVVRSSDLRLRENIIPPSYEGTDDFGMSSSEKPVASLPPPWGSGHDSTRNWRNRLIINEANSHRASETVQRSSEWSSSSLDKSRMFKIEGMNMMAVVPVRGLYSQLQHLVKFSCESFGLAGKYTVKLITDLVNSPVIATSGIMQVEWNKDFSLHIGQKTVAECTDSISVSYSRPECTGQTDRIRMYATFRANVTSANPPIVPVYVSERSLIQDPKVLHFQCGLFNRGAVDYCFSYVTKTRSLAVATVLNKCIPIAGPIVDGEWGAWSEWTNCISSCGFGKRLRHRYCDQPPPSSTGAFCKGEPLQIGNCTNPTCPTEVVTPESEEPTDEVIHPTETHHCACGCSFILHRFLSSSVSASAAQCTGQAVWLIQGVEGFRIHVEFQKVWLRPGKQWLKIRDGNTPMSPLLIRLPTHDRPHNHPTYYPTYNPETVQDGPRGKAADLSLVSTGIFLLVEFRSDLNSSEDSFLEQWGFSIVAKVEKAEDSDGIAVATFPDSGSNNSSWALLAAVHITAIVFLGGIMACIAVFAVYHVHRYQTYKRATLIVESPCSSPTDGPLRKSYSSTQTVSEVVSLKSFSFSLKPQLPKSLTLKLRNKGGKTYTSLKDDEGSASARRGGHEESRHSLPNSPFLTRRSASGASTPANMRRSSTQFGKLFQRESRAARWKKRKSASFDGLQIRCISPIDEWEKEDDIFIQNEDAKEIKEDKEGEGAIPKVCRRHRSPSGNESNKYREYRKSQLSDEEKQNQNMKSRDVIKLNKEKFNLEKLRRRTSELSRSNSIGTVRAASSVSEISMAGTEMELEIDYYDYDVCNASAVPGSLFGLDPSLMPWIPPFIPFLDDEENEEEKEGCSIQMQQLNITEPENKVSQEDLSKSNENNEDLAETKAQPDPQTTPTPETKILNIDDIQFADEDSDDEIID
ncbi:thrombospondin-1 like protein golden goal [Oratosquilla oratoria]|uniref:thrombospondin-1 like protein golden goal n=1 Tax=Oratosquilla oratoria TaxID=337810 RepID=UPI003F7716FD